MMSGWVELAIAFVTGVIGPITVLYIKNKLDQGKKKPDMVKETLRVSELVTNKIEHIKEEFNADRVWITQFHKGGNF
jgi:capsular polysaccharide biosynthesis protein